MAGVAASLGPILLSALIAAAAAEKAACDLYAAVGGSATLPLDFKGLKDTHTLRWTHNASIVFYRERGRVTVGTARDISATGSLLLRDLQSSGAGLYKATVVHPNGTLATTWEERLCLQDNVSKPLLSYVCADASTVSLKCEVAKRQGMEFSWTLDDKLTGDTRETLTMSLAAPLNGRSSIRCRVANEVSAQRSDAVRPACQTQVSPPRKPVCLPLKTVAAMMAGAGGVILLLSAALLATCFYYRCNPKTRAQPEDKGDVRMMSLKKWELESAGPDYETMHPSEDPPPAAPSPKPSPRARYQSATAPDGQTGNGSLQPTTATEGGQPSPVPKPRTKPVNL